MLLVIILYIIAAAIFEFCTYEAKSYNIAAQIGSHASIIGLIVGFFNYNSIKRIRSVLQSNKARDQFIKEINKVQRALKATNPPKQDVESYLQLRARLLATKQLKKFKVTDHISNLPATITTANQYTALAEISEIKDKLVSFQTLEEV